MTKEIPLTQGRVALVDDGDFLWLNKYKWCANKMHGGKHWYATRGKSANGKTKVILLHRVIIGADAEEHVDHKNGDGLDNRRCNLRICTMSQNQANSKLRSDNTSGYKGVRLHKGKWVANIKVNGQRHWLGYFPTVEGAAVAYDKAAQEHFGEFARFNFPPHSPDSQ